MQQGRFIVFEGGEGVGKTTQVPLLVKALAQAGLSTRTEREPGGTALGETIRPILKSHHYPEINEWHALCGYNFSRMAYLFEVVKPTLSQGQWLVSDRFAFSTIVYQGYAGGLPPEVVEAVTNGVVGSYWPDITFILDMPAAESLARRNADQGDGTRYEEMDMSFHNKVREGYLHLHEKNPHNTAVINATQPQNVVHRAILTELNTRFALNLQPVI